MEKSEALTKDKIETSTKVSTKEIPDSTWMSLYAKYKCAKVSFFGKNHKIYGEVTTDKAELWNRERLQQRLPKEIKDRFKKYQKETWGFGIRRDFFLKRIEEQVKLGARQIVSLASGLDPLLEEIKIKYPHVNCYEMDLKKVIDYKIATCDKSVDVNYIEGDVFAEFDKLFDEKYVKAPLKKNVKTSFLLEGILPYKKEEQAINLINKKINQEFTAETWVNADALTKNGIQNVYKKYAAANIAIEHLKEKGEVVITGYDDFQKEIAEKSGFKITNKQSCAEIITTEKLGDKQFPPLQEHWVYTMHSEGKEDEISETMSMKN